MKRNILILCMMAAMGAQAQQLQTSSMYDMQGVFHNPSAAGTIHKGIVGVSYRSQWGGISGSPKTATVFGSFDLPEHKIAIGGYAYNDKTGPTSRTGLQLSFAKYIPMPNNARFSLGIETRFQQFALDREKLQQTLGNDPVLGNSDNQFKFDAGFGISYTGNKLQIGASVSQLVQSKLNFYSGNLNPTEEARLYRHYYLHGRYKINAGGNTTITPNFLMIYLPNAPTDFQFGARVEHSEVFWWGLGARMKQSFMLSAGVHLNKKFTAGYSFDIYNNPSDVFSRGADGHEILLRYNIIK